MKKLYGSGVYVQSAGVENDLEIDGFAIAVCQEIDVELSRHRARSFDEMDKLGDDLSSFDLIVALSPASQRRALDLTRLFHLEVEYWPILDPTGLAETRDTQLRSYRQTRDQIMGAQTAMARGFAEINTEKDARVMHLSDAASRAFDRA